MEATIFTGCIYDHLLPHAAQVKVAHPVMLRAIALAKKKNDRPDASKIADCLRCDLLAFWEIALVKSTVVLAAPWRGLVSTIPISGLTHPKKCAR